MIQVLESKLQEAKKERAKAIAPYDARIKKLNSAIRSLKEFNRISYEINDTEKEPVCEIPDIEETQCITK